jgi:competence protein ComEC
VLARTGGVAITLATGHVATVAQPGDAHPWHSPPTVAPALPPRLDTPRARAERDRPDARPWRHSWPRFPKPDSSTASTARR